MAVYTPGSSTIVHSVRADLLSRGIPDIAHFIQYDNQIPILAVSLYAGEEVYTVPSGTAITLRVGKPDGTVVVSDALGTNSAGNVVYFAVTEQMAAAVGNAMAVVTLEIGDKVAASGAVILRMDRNPAQEEDLESVSEINILLMMSAADIVVSSTQPSNVPVLWFDTSAV